MLNIVVVGAGVIGLTTALELGRSGKARITVIAKHMPGDHDVTYASPWTGVYCLPTGIMEGTATDNTRGDGASRMERVKRDTWAELMRLERDVPESGVKCTEARVLLDSMEKRFPCILVNTSLYLPWLVSQCLRLGVRFSQSVVEHIVTASRLHHTGQPADVVVNCTGLSSRDLGGIEDKSVFPSRGHIVVIHNDAPTMFASDHLTYILPTPAGGGTVLGERRQDGVWDAQSDSTAAETITGSCSKMLQHLFPHGIDLKASATVIREEIGLAPLRSGGVRTETEIISGIAVVHNYCHGRNGYETSYGSARAVVDMVEREFTQERRTTTASRRALL